MADIISLDKKLDLAKDKKAALIRRRKVLAVQKVFQCTHCSLKCEKCGTQIEHDPDARAQTRRDGGFDRFKNLDWKPHTILKRSAVGVCSVV